MENDIQKRVEETLNTENYIQPVLPKAFLLTRVKARMDSESVRSVIRFIPASLKVVCSAILIVNAAYFLSSILKPENDSDQLASFYRFNSSSVYSR
jgi:hypothetical protein